MRKKLMVAATVLILLLLAFGATLQYRQYSSYKIPVHASAHNMVKINADELIQLFVKTYGINFKKKLSKSPTKREASLNTGIWLPANLFVYNLKGKAPGTWFVSIPLASQKDFLQFAATRWHLRWQQKNGLHYGNNASGGLQVVCNSEYASIAWASPKQNVQQQLAEILNSSGMDVQHAKFTARFKKMHEPITAIMQDGDAALWFRANELMFRATTDSIKGFSIPAAKQQVAPTQGTHSFVSINGTFASTWFKPVYHIKQHSFRPDSLLAHFGSYTYFSVGANSVQKDSITTYEFDDNFEKVAKVTVTEVQVPALQLSLSAAPGLMQYLMRQNIISQKMELNKDVFPLYQVQVREQMGMLHFNTQRTTAMQHHRVQHFAEARIDVGKVAAQLQLSVIDPYVKNMLILQARGAQHNDKLVFTGSLLFTQNALKQLADIVNGLK